MSGAISTNYFNNPFAFTMFNYSSNPMANLSSSLFGLSSGNFDLNNFAIGNLSNVPNWNADLMMPQWMQNLQNMQYGFQQYNFNGLGAYNTPIFQTAQTTAQAGGTQAQQAQVGGATTAQPAQRATVTNPYTQYAQQAQASEDTMKLNMYGISTTGDAKKDAAALKNAQAKENKVKEQAAKIAEDLYDAMKGAGTKNDKLKAALGRLNNDNILQVLEDWNNNYSADMDGESLIQSIQDEYHSGFFSNEQKNVEKILCDALFNKAKSLGMNSEAHAFRAKVNAEHGNSWWLGGSSDKEIQTCVDTIVSQIAQKDVQNRQGAYNRAVSKNK